MSTNFSNIFCIFYIISHWKISLANTPSWHFAIHLFTHLNAGLLITSSVDVRTVIASLGHSQTSTTLDIYSHTFEAVQAQAENYVADALPFKISKKA